MLSFFLVLLAGCGKEEADFSQARVEVVFSPGGVGDQGYNDNILRGLQTAAVRYGFTLAIHIPEEKEQGIQIYNEWLNAPLDNDCERSLFVFSGREYEYLLQGLTLPKDARKDVLMFETEQAVDGIYTFFYAATPDCHKNFELACKAAQKLEDELGKNRFRLILTINGNENKYAQWLYTQWGMVDSIKFHGFMDKHTLYQHYASVDCLIFPSRIETWGLPITEFSQYKKPMLLANLPYAHETAAGSSQVAYFDPRESEQLQTMMSSLIHGDASFLCEIPIKHIKSPRADSWGALFNLLTNTTSKTK